MQLSQVNYFIESARQLNFTRAAATCGVSQPALSRGIKALEREFGGPLLHRTPTVAVTDLGRRVLPYLQQIQEAAKLAGMQAKSLADGAVVPLSIGVDGSVDTGVLGKLLREMQHRYGGLSLRLETGSPKLLLPLLLDGGLDVMLRGHHGGDDAHPLHRVTLMSEECVVIHPPGHAFAGTGPLDATHLLRAPDRIRFCDTAEMLLANLGPLAPPRHHASGAEDFCQLLDSNCGWGVVAASHPLAADRPTRHVGPQALRRTVELVYVAGRMHAPGIATLIRLARVQESQRAKAA